MSEVYRSEGVVTGPGDIHAHDLPFETGQRVELVVWPSPAADVKKASRDEIAQRLARLDELDKWIRKNVPATLPQLSAEDMSRDTIYEGRGL